jgi:hypothetical protein
VVEGSGKANGRGFWVLEFKVNRHQLRVWRPLRWSIVMIAIMFHIVGYSFGGLIINLGKDVIFSFVS